MATARELLAVAAKEIGYNETPRNRTKYGRAYGMDGVAWCQMFVWWVCRQAGVPIIKTAYTPTAAGWFKNRGKWRPYNSKAVRPGDLGYIYYPHMGRIAHVFFVRSVTPAGNLITIEGNTNQGGSRTGGGVAQGLRTRQTMTRYGGFGVLDLEPDFPPAGKHPHPIPNIRFSDSGEHVKDAQRHLNALKKKAGLDHTLKVDGVWGHDSKNRMKEFQAWAKIPVTGTVGGTTWATLHKHAGVKN